MATVQEVKDGLLGLRTAVDTANARMDLIITLVANLRSGNIATQADIDEIKASVDALSLTLADVLGKQSNVLA
jgi:hypothetical protein